MTRKSRRELERAVEGLDGDDSGDVEYSLIVFETEGGEYVDADGRTLPTDDAGDLLPSSGAVIVMPPEGWKRWMGGDGLPERLTKQPHG